MSRKNRVLNRTKFKIKGLNQERLLNNLSKNVKVYNFKRQDYHTCEFETDYSKSKNVKARIVENGCEILSISHFGFWAKIKKLATSYGIIIALILAFLFYGIQYSFIWQIEVYGENVVVEKELEEFVLKSLTSKVKSKINTKEIEAKIKDNFQDISSVSVAIIGQTLVLNLNEAVLPEEMLGEYQPLVSNFDGLVTEINLIQGTLAVNEGSLVRKGDILVYPYVIDSQGQERAVAPKAEIYADVWISEKIMHYDYQVIVRRTGEKIVKSDVFLNDLLIYSQNCNIKFEQFETEQEEFSLTQNLILPFILKKTTYYETETIEIKQEFHEVKNKILQTVREKTLIFLEENEIIKEEKYILREEGGCHEVTFVLTVSRNIGG